MKNKNHVTHGIPEATCSTPQPHPGPEYKVNKAFPANT